MMPHLRWIFGVDDEPQPAEPVFDETADLKPLILAALDSADPGGTLRDLWPWVPTQTRLGLVIRARIRDDEPLDVLAARYEHAVRAHWADQHDRPPLWRRLLRRKGSE